MAGTAKGEKKEKPVPVKCVCGADAAYVKARQGKMVCCPNVLFCAKRSRWHSSLNAAIVDWNTVVAGAKTKE